MKTFEIYFLNTTSMTIKATRVYYDENLTRFQILNDGQYETIAVFTTNNIIGWEEVR